jgi:hypothetical protein
MTRPHLKYRKEDFNDETLRATELLFEAKPWRLDLGQLDLYQRWADVVCDAYAVDPIGIQKVDYDASGFGYIVDPDTGAANIIIGKYSIATLFCSLGAHIAQDSFDHIEWGFSLFYVVRPVMFRRRVREGRIIGLTARDTFSAGTWDRLTELGLTNGNFLFDPHFDIRTLDAEDDLVNPDEVAEADESEELAPVVDLFSNDRLLQNEWESYVQRYGSNSITFLRQMSRGVISGGYNMPKAELLKALFDAGVEVGL